MAARRVSALPAPAGAVVGDQTLQLGAKPEVVHRVISLCQQDSGGVVVCLVSPRLVGGWKTSFDGEGAVSWETPVELVIVPAVWFVILLPDVDVKRLNRECKDAEYQTRLTCGSSLARVLYSVWLPVLPSQRRGPSSAHRAPVRTDMARRTPYSPVASSTSSHLSSGPSSCMARI